MSHIERLEEIRVNLVGRGLTRLEVMVDSLLADMKAERTTIIDKMDKLEELSKPLVAADGREPTINNVGTVTGEPLDLSAVTYIPASKVGQLLIEDTLYDLNGEVIKDNMFGVK